MCLVSYSSRLFPPASADRRQLLRSGLQPASRGNQHHRGNPALYRQRRRHDLGGSVWLSQQHCGFCRHAQWQTEEGKLLPLDIEIFLIFHSFAIYSAAPWDHLAVIGGNLFISNFTRVLSGAEMKCSRLYFSLCGRRWSASVKPVHLTSNLKAVRGQSATDCQCGHVRHQALRPCFQRDIPRPLSLKGIAFHRSFWPIFFNANLHERRPKCRPHRFVVVKFVFRWSPVVIFVCHFV